MWTPDGVNPPTKSASMTTTRPLDKRETDVFELPLRESRSHRFPPRCNRDCRAELKSGR